MDNQTAKQLASQAQAGSKDDLGKLLRAIVEGKFQIADGDFVTLSIGGTEVTASAAEINLLDGVTATTAEINKLDGIGDVIPSAAAAVAYSETGANLAAALVAFGIMEAE